MFEGNARAAALRRLSRIAGQVKGVRRMVEEGRYCIDVLQQIAAVEAALHRVGGIILKNHIETCVSEAFESSRPVEQQRKIAELVNVFDSMRTK